MKKDKKITIKVTSKERDRIFKISKQKGFKSMSQFVLNLIFNQEEKL